MAQFIVTLEDPIFPGEPVTSLDIKNSLMYGGSGWRGVTVRRYDPFGEARTNKIQAIKRVRTLLECSLRDAKFLADTAEVRGSAAWSTVTVECDGTRNGFRVLDNS